MNIDPTMTCFRSMCVVASLCAGLTACDGEGGPTSGAHTTALVFQGTVRDEGGAPLAGVVVTLGRHGSCIPIATVADAPLCLATEETDAEGRYRIHEPVDYPCSTDYLWLTAVATGYEVQAVSEGFACTASPQVFDFQLTPAPALSPVRQLATADDPWSFTPCRNDRNPLVKKGACFARPL